MKEVLGTCGYLGHLPVVNDWSDYVKMAAEEDTVSAELAYPHIASHLEACEECRWYTEGFIADIFD